MNKKTYIKSFFKQLYSKLKLNTVSMLLLFVSAYLFAVSISSNGKDTIGIIEKILSDKNAIMTSVLVILTITLITKLSRFILDQKDFDGDKIQGETFEKLEELRTKSDSINSSEQPNTQEQLPTEIPKDSITTIIDDCILESSKISERIYNNSKTYLFVGLTVAILGVSFFIFYGLTNDSNNPSRELLERALDYLPRVGALFFIEFIAFFFLKQYRILLEEYRYYESIKRDRQHKKLIIEIVDKYKDSPETLKLIIDYMDNHSIKIPEITGDHKIESEKALYKDMDILDKFVELSKIIKK